MSGLNCYPIQIIKILHLNGEVSFSPALIIGQIAVSPAYPDSFAQNDVILGQTGLLIAAFSSHHVAVNFAKRLNEWYDLESLIAQDDKELFDAIGAEIKNMMLHKSFIPFNERQLESSRNSEGWEIVRGNKS